MTRVAPKITGEPASPAPPAPEAGAPEAGKSAYQPPFRLNPTLLCLVGLLLGLFLQRNLFEPLRAQLDTTATLSLTANINAGTSIEVYVNGDYHRPYRDAIVQGVMHRYVFHDVPGEINSLRIDLTDTPKTTILLGDLELLVNGERKAMVARNELDAWGKNQLVPVEGEHTFQASGNDPFLHANGLSLSSGEDQVPLRNKISRRLGLIAAAVLALLFFISPLGWRMFLPAAALLLACSYIGRFAAEYLLSLPIGAPSVREAVGNAGFTGYAKQPERAVIIAAFALASALGMLLALLTRRRADVFPAACETVPTNSASMRWGTARVILPLLVYAALYFPPAEFARDTFLSQRIQYAGYDWSNVYTWDFLNLYGFVPLRDFWFPYFGFADQLGFHPEGVTDVYLMRLVLVTAIYLAVYQLCGRRMLAALAVLLPAALLIELGILLGTIRYSASVAAVLSAVAIAIRPPRSVLPYAAFGALLGWMFHFEPSQIGFALPGLVVAAVLSLATAEDTAERRRRFERLVLAGATACVLAVLEMAHLYANGQLQGFVDFFMRMDAMGAASAIPAAVGEWFAFAPKADNVLLLSALTFASYGTFCLCSRAGRELGAIMLSMSLIVLMVYFKMLIRPHMALQMFVPIAVGAGLYFAWWSRAFRSTEYFALAALIGLGVGHSPLYENIKALAVDRANAVQDLPENAEAATTRFTVPQLDSHYALERIDGIDPDAKEVVTYLQEQNLPRFGGKAYIFGDDSYLYTILKERPCPYITFYNTSDVWAQHETVDCLTARKPAFVVWDSTFAKFDGVPNPVRVPIVYEHIVKSFVPHHAIGRYQILRTRQPGEAVDWNYLRLHLTDTLELGALPHYSSFESLPACPAGATNCAEFAVIEGGSQTLTDLFFQIEGMLFRVVFSASSSDKPLVVNLSRLWFWELAQGEGKKIEIVPPPPPLKVRVEQRLLPANILY